MELGELDPEEAAIFMEELGLTESSLDRVIKLSYQLVGLISLTDIFMSVEEQGWTEEK